MATTKLLTVLVLASALTCAAQNQNGTWIFNVRTGLDFMTAPPTVLHNYNGFWGNTAVMSDENGDLLLYSDDTHIWNGEGQVLVNGDGLFNSIYTNTPQSSMILPWPGHPGEYYMIQPYPWNPNDPDSRTFYHRIEMNAGGGVGEVMEKNIVLADSAGAYMAAVLDSAGTGIWVILHHLTAARFMAYHLDAFGLSTVAVVSEAGLPSEFNAYQGYGILRPSPHGEHLYLLRPYYNWTTNCLLHMMDFDRTTGQISGFSTFGGPGYGGLEISPSGQFLYCNTYVCDSTIASRLWQYDISSGDSATIQASKTLVYEAPKLPGPCLGLQGNLALAVDGRIYCAVSFANHLGVINQPDLPAPACEYVHQGLYLDGDTSWLWLPNQMREYPITNTAIADGESAVDRLHIRPNPARDGCRITLPERGIRSVLLMDATGRAVREVPCAPGQREVRVERDGITSGIYQAIARDANGSAVAAGRMVFE